MAELVRCLVNALDPEAPEGCLVCDGDESGAVTVADVVLAVRAALGVCESDPCPLAPGTYTLTAGDGSNMQIRADGFLPVQLPAGGRLVMDVGPAAAPACNHDVVVPIGGLELPAACTYLGFRVRTVQTGCGVGRIDSNGNADYTLDSVGDTSDVSPVCNLPDASACGPVREPDAAGRVDVTVGDGSPDACASGTAHLLVSVPVRTIIWRPDDASCLQAGESYDPERDALIAEFIHTLDLTTDTASSHWADLDGDDCPARVRNPRMVTGSGTCLDLQTRTVTVASAAAVPMVAPLRDPLTTTTLPLTLTGPEPALGAACATTPALPRAGTTTRCVE